MTLAACPGPGSELDALFCVFSQCWFYKSLSKQVLPPFHIWKKQHLLQGYKTNQWHRSVVFFSCLLVQSLFLQIMLLAFSTQVDCNSWETFRQRDAKFSPTTSFRASDMVMKVDALLSAQPKGDARIEYQFFEDRHRYRISVEFMHIFVFLSSFILPFKVYL